MPIALPGAGWEKLINTWFGPSLKKFTGHTWGEKSKDWAGHMIKSPKKWSKQYS